eukprot:2003746-Alexandrium_andersonii.AAC.1
MSPCVRAAFAVSFPPSALRLQCACCCEGATHIGMSWIGRAVAFPGSHAATSVSSPQARESPSHLRG